MGSANEVEVVAFEERADNVCTKRERHSSNQKNKEVIFYTFCCIVLKEMLMEQYVLISQKEKKIFQAKR